MQAVRRISALFVALVWSVHAWASRYSDATPDDDGLGAPDGFQGDMLLIQAVLTLIALVVGWSGARARGISTLWRVIWGVGTALYIAMTWVKPEPAILLAGLLLIALIIAVLWPSGRRPPR